MLQAQGSSGGMKRRKKTIKIAKEERKKEKNKKKVSYDCIRTQNNLRELPKPSRKR